MLICVCVKRHMCRGENEYACRQHVGARANTWGCWGGQAEEVAGTARVLIPLLTVTGGENSECDNVTALHKLRNPLGLPPGQEVRSKATWPLEAQNISQWIQLSNLTLTQSNEMGVHCLFKNTSAVSLVHGFWIVTLLSYNLPLCQCLICRQLYIPQRATLLEFISWRARSFSYHSWLQKQ